LHLLETSTGQTLAMRARPDKVTQTIARSF
jgi:hypothetical protein